MSLKQMLLEHMSLKQMLLKQMLLKQMSLKMISNSRIIIVSTKAHRENVVMGGMSLEQMSQENQSKIF
jgi:hypothetical protein